MDSPEKVMKKEAIFKNELFQEQLTKVTNAPKNVKNKNNPCVVLITLMVAPHFFQVKFSMTSLYSRTLTGYSCPADPHCDQVAESKT
jgi:hypothetical protein